MVGYLLSYSFQRSLLPCARKIIGTLKQRGSESGTEQTGWVEGNGVGMDAEPGVQEVSVQLKMVDWDYG